MSKMFTQCKNLDCNLNEWDVSSVKDMSEMFYSCFKFNSNLSKWDVSSVKNMYKMFSNCIKFKGDGLEFWKLNNLERAVRMFESCYNLSTDLSNWDISNIKSLRFMFYDCKSNILPDWYNKNFFED
jgi:surface protein